MIPSKEKVEAIIEELQKIMRIQDWDIEFRYVSELEAREMSEGDTSISGNCMRKRNSEESIISINVDNQKIKEIPDYWYHTLVHEMYHIVTDRFIYEVDEITDLIPDKDLRKIWQKPLKSVTKNW